MLTKKELKFLGKLLYESENPMAMVILDKIDEMVIEYGMEDN